MHKSAGAGHHKACESLTYTQTLRFSQPQVTAPVVGPVFFSWKFWMVPNSLGSSLRRRIQEVRERALAA